ncbi:hypothetical protein ACVGXP_12925, partial [Enterobacter hormaechei]
PPPPPVFNDTPPTEIYTVRISSIYTGRISAAPAHVYKREPLLLLDWSGGAAGTRVYGLTSRSGLTSIFFFSSLPATL